MELKALEILTSCETDVDGALQRFYGDEQLYATFLSAFLSEPTMDELCTCIENREWKNAFMAAHALKGIAANLGFIPLFQAISELVLVLRTGKLGDINPIYLETKLCYNNIISSIKQFLILSGRDE